MTSKNNSGFYFLNCLHSFRTINKLELYKKVCENKDFCNAIMPSEDTKIVKAPFIIYADLECIIEKIPSSFPMSTISSFKSIQNKHDIYRGKDCVKNFCEFLREHTVKIIN